MKNNETPETMLDHALHSAKLKKITVILILICMLICIILLFPPIQKIIFSIITIFRPKTSGGGLNEIKELLSILFFGLVVLTFAICCLFSKIISAFLEDAKNEQLITILSIGIGVLLLGFISIFSYQHGVQWLNSDHSSEMVLGKLLADENSLVSRNWHYSTEIRLIYQTIFIMPLFKLIGRYENWALIRALAIFFNNLLLILSYLFMTKQMKIQKKWGFITSLFLIMPISGVYWDIVTFGGYYILFLAQIFFCLGLFFRLTNSDTNKTLLIDFILFTTLSFLLGVQGIRSLLSVHIPLSITCIYLYFKTTQKKKFPFFLGCYSFFVCCIGFAINYLLHFRYSFHSYGRMRLVNLPDEFLTKLGQSLVCLAEFFGFSSESFFISSKGLFSVITIIGTFIFFRIFIKQFRKTNLQNNTMLQFTEYYFLPAYFIISVIFNIFIFIIIDESITLRYFIPFLVLYIPLIAILFENIEKICEHLKRIAIISGIVLFILGQSYINFQDLGETYSVINTPVTADRKGYIRYLLDNHLDYGFATFWNANVTTELSNGKIELAGLSPDGLNPCNNYLRINGWLNPVKFYDPFFHQGESFLLLTRDEWELAQKTGRSFAELAPDYEDNNFIIIRYPSAEIIYREVLDN